MNKKEMRKSINATAKAAKKDFRFTYGSKTQRVNISIIEINRAIPYVAINHKNLFLQGDEAASLLNDASEASEKFTVSIENAIIWLASGW